MLELALLVALEVSAQPPKPLSHKAVVAAPIDSIVSSRTAMFLRGDTLRIEGRGERKSGRRQVYLILPDSVFQLVDGQRRTVPRMAEEAIRGTAANVRDFARRFPPSGVTPSHR
jgi:hypothetical protein